MHSDGTVERISFGLLNLSHRQSHAAPEPMQPGRFEEVEVSLNEIALAVPAGCRLRLSLSTGYWPMIWPAPEPVTLTVDTAGSALYLPVLAREEGLPEVTFAPPACAPAGSLTVLAPARVERSHSLDIGADRVVFTVDRDDDAWIVDDIGSEMRFTKRKIQSVNRWGDPQPLAEVATARHFARGTWCAGTETLIRMTADAKAFHFQASLRKVKAG